MTIIKIDELSLLCSLERDLQDYASSYFCMGFSFKVARSCIAPLLNTLGLHSKEYNLQVDFEKDQMF